MVLTDPLAKEVTLFTSGRKREIESYPVSVTSNSKTPEIHGEMSKVSSDFHERSKEACCIKEELSDHWNQYETTDSHYSNKEITQQRHVVHEESNTIQGTEETNTIQGTEETKLTDSYAEFKSVDVKN